MVGRFFVGDKVWTRRGVGRVVRVITWRDAISEFENDFEAEEFCSKCKVEVGINFREDWVKLMVDIGGVSRPFQAIGVKLLEGRYVDSEDELGESLIKEGSKKSRQVGRNTRKGDEEEEE